MTSVALLRRPRALPEDWPVHLVLYGYVVAWMLGVSGFVWMAMAVPMAMSLWGRRRVVTPPFFGSWLFFLAWVALSGTQIDTVTRGMVLAYRASVYVAAAVAFLFVYNLRHARVSDRIAFAVSFYWLTTAVGGWLAILAPEIQFTSLAQQVLPSGITAEPYVRGLVEPVVAQIHEFLGFPIARPAAPFASTNEWGSTLGLFLPIFLYWSSRLTGWRREAALLVGASAIVPAIQSLNRGLWLTVLVFAAYASTRYALQGRVRPLLALGALASLLALSLVMTPLGDLIVERTQTGHSDARRLTLYQMSVDAVLDSPLVGHGGPIPDPDQPERAPAGTHGQVWLVSVLHGIPALIAFVAFLGALVWRSRNIPPSSFGFWANIVFVLTLVQMFFYSLIPSQLPIVFVIAGVAMREAPSRSALGGDEL